ncbi:MAG TPA: polymer-forming cytoskeletal family protein [Treponema sp.]|nr:polymer-forming cytoskeletal family protein [Treponema sp.]
MARFLDREKERDITVFGKNTSFCGILTFSEELHIEGKFEGSIESKGALVIKKDASCSVDHIQADSITVEGMVDGDISALDRIEMKTGSSVKGNVSAARLRIADGVSFEGSVEMVTAVEPVDIFTIRSDLLKNRLLSRDSE